MGKTSFTRSLKADNWEKSHGGSKQKITAPSGDNSQLCVSTSPKHRIRERFPEQLSKSQIPFVVLPQVECGRGYYYEGGQRELTGGDDDGSTVPSESLALKVRETVVTNGVEKVNRKAMAS